jgi:hypothetical protein
VSTAARGPDRDWWGAAYSAATVEEVVTMFRDLLIVALAFGEVALFWLYRQDRR